MYVVELRPKVETWKSIMYGKLYIDAKTFRLLRFDGAVRGLKVNVSRYDESGEQVQPATIRIQVHYTHRRGFTEVEKASAQIHSDRLDASMVLADPIVSGGLRLDSVVTASGGDVVYHYVQTISAGPGLRKADITLGGEVFEEDRLVCEIPRSKPITFYISSLSGLAEDIDRYLLEIRERRVLANTACYIEFTTGSAVIDTSLGNTVTVRPDNTPPETAAAATQ